MIKHRTMKKPPRLEEPVAHALARTRHDHVTSHFKRGLRVQGNPPPSRNSDQTGGTRP